MNFRLNYTVKQTFIWKFLINNLLLVLRVIVLAMQEKKALLLSCEAADDVSVYGCMIYYS